MPCRLQKLWGRRCSGNSYPVSDMIAVKLVKRYLGMMDYLNVWGVVTVIGDSVSCEGTSKDGGAMFTLCTKQYYASVGQAVNVVFGRMQEPASLIYFFPNNPLSWTLATFKTTQQIV